MGATKELSALDDLITERATRKARAEARLLFQRFAQDVERLTRKPVNEITVDDKPFNAFVQMIYNAVLEDATKEYAYLMAAEILKHADDLAFAKPDGEEVVITEEEG